jgi:hypothetical protein
LEFLPNQRHNGEEWIDWLCENPLQASSFYNTAASGIDSFLNKINELKVDDKNWNT